MGLIDVIKEQIEEKLNIPKNVVSDKITKIEDDIRAGNLNDVEAKLEDGEKAIKGIESAPRSIEEGKNQLASVRKTVSGTEQAASILEKAQTIAASLNPAAAALAYAQKIVIDKAKAEVADIKNLELIINPIIDNFEDFIASEKKRLSDLKREAKEMKRIKKLREEKYKV